MGIGNILKRLLEEHDKNVNELAQEIKVSPQTLYSIIKRDNMKVDFDILLKICDYLNVDVELFYNNKNNNREEDVKLTPHENKLISAYRKNIDMQSAVDRLLGIDDEPKGKSIGDDISETLEKNAIYLKKNTK